MYPFKQVNTREPVAKEFVGPPLRFQNPDGEGSVVIDGVDDDFHQMDTV